MRPAKNTAKRHNGLLSKGSVGEEEATTREKKRVESCWIMWCLRMKITQNFWAFIFGKDLKLFGLFSFRIFVATREAQNHVLRQQISTDWRLRWQRRREVDIWEASNLIVFRWQTRRSGITPWLKKGEGSRERKRIALSIFIFPFLFDPSWHCLFSHLR